MKTVPQCGHFSLPFFSLISGFLMLPHKVRKIHLFHSIVVLVTENGIATILEPNFMCGGAITHLSIGRPSNFHSLALLHGL
jgi:hypothetical protein